MSPFEVGLKVYMFQQILLIPLCRSFISVLMSAFKKGQFREIDFTIICGNSMKIEFEILYNELIVGFPNLNIED